jgi:glycosyltransferase involved in cell wall biosynthesis
MTAAVVPCFNESPTIGPLVSQLRQYLDLIVVVDDGSTDETAIIAKDAGAIILRHDRNLGKGAALQTGLSYLRNLGCEWAATLDGDGQHAPADFPALFRCAEQTGASLVIGNRMGNAEAMPWLRRFVNHWMSTQLSRCAGRPLPDTQSGFRLIHLQTWTDLRLSAQRFEIESEMLMAFLAASHRVEFAAIRVIPAARKSRIRPIADSLRWWNWWRRMKNRVTERQRNSSGHGVSGIRPTIKCGLEKTSETQLIHSTGT